MIHYSMMPSELIFEQQQTYPTQSLLQFKGVSIVIEKVNMDDYKIVRLLSTNPSDFLDESFSPGNIISLNSIAHLL